MFDQCRWINEPAHWRLIGDELQVVTDQKTDFWRETHYAMTRHTGHVFGRATAGDFTATVRVRARFEALYDQAGIMVLLDDATWIKAGLEMFEGRPSLGSVLTVGRSDWATGPFDGDPTDVWLSVSVRAGVLCVRASSGGVRWSLVRLCPFPRAATYVVGPMCCTPERAGLQVLFSAFTVTAASAITLTEE